MIYCLSVGTCRELKAHNYHNFSQFLLLLLLPHTHHIYFAIHLQNLRYDSLRLLHHLSLSFYHSLQQQSCSEYFKLIIKQRAMNKNPANMATVRHLQYLHSALV